MQKIKNAVFEHRFGLFFFIMLTFFGFLIMDPFKVISAKSVAYSFYCVDFTFGFCTKLLPGAIYNLIVGVYNEIAISIYVKVLAIVTTIVIAFFFERLLYKRMPEERKELFFIFSFSTIIICFSFFEAGLIYLLDLHWIIATLFILICLSNKKLYIFIPIGLVYAIMTHYISIICYVAVSLLILLYKAYNEENKKERIFLFSLFIFSVILSSGLFLYMLIYELDNLTISYPQMMNVLEARGVGQTDYYRFAFFRDLVEEIFHDRYTDETIGWISDIDQNQPMIKIMIDTVIQQFRINAYLSDHKSVAPSVFVFIPGIMVITGNLLQRIKAARVFEKLIYLAGLALFAFILMFGLLFSTDTIRWIGNAMLVLIIFYVSVVGLDKKSRTEAKDIVSYLPDGVYYLYIIICALITLI